MKLVDGDMVTRLNEVPGNESRQWQRSYQAKDGSNRASMKRREMNPGNMNTQGKAA